VLQWDTDASVVWWANTKQNFNSEILKS